MNLRHLLIFKTVVDTGNFTKAAKQLFITQSGVSHAIRELEQQQMLSYSIVYQRQLY